MSSDDEEKHLEPPTDADGDVDAQITVPWERLSAVALRGVIEEYVTREGTEYGDAEVSLEKKVADVQRQLERAEVVVLFDAKAETVNLARASDLERSRKR